MNPPVIPAKPDIVMPPSSFQTVGQSTFGGVTSPPSTPHKNKKVFFAILGVIILTITTLSGFLLIARPVLFKSSAWNCGAYTFDLSKAGVVTVTNGSTNDEPLQRADVYIDNQKVQTFDVPALAAGESKELGTITVPTTTFSWQINGTSDCSNAGRVEIGATSYQCQNIKAYSEDGSTLLSAADLSALAAGSKIRLVAVGTGAAANYSAVRFTVNGTLLTESVLSGTSGDYYDVYTVPASVTTFAITAQLKGADGNWY
jgi:hypothetical protein